VKLFSLSKIKGYAFDVELFLLARTIGLKISKVPVSLIERHHSKVRLSLDAPMMFWDVLNYIGGQAFHPPQPLPFLKGGNCFG
jgi:hypothetical protein